MRRGLVHRALGKTGLSTSFVGFGALEIGRDWGLGDAARPDEDAAIETVRGMLDLGINLIDSARAYHRSEERIGKALEGIVHNATLATKCGEHCNEPDTHYDFSYDAIASSIDTSLELLGVNRIDLMQIHFGPDPEKVLEEGETLRAMKDAQKEGKIWFIGASPNEDIARQCAESGDFDVLQIEYSLLNRSSEHVLDICRDRNIGVLVKAGLAHGALTPKAVDHFKELDEGTQKTVKPLLDLVGGDGDKLMQLALNFLYRNEAVSSVLLGTKSVQHMAHNLGLLEEEIDEALMDKAIALTA